MNNKNRIEILKARSGLLRCIRNFFFEKGFIEVQTPVLSKDTMVDRTIEPIKVQLQGINRTFFLQTSPEFSMKRLLLDGVHSIFEITPVFRDAEQGSLHSPEFTMLEWYRVGDNYQQGMDFLVEFVQALLPGRTVSQISYRQAFENEFGINPHIAGFGDLDSLCHQRGLSIPAGPFDSDLLLQLLMSEILEPKLGIETTCVLFDWPETQSALAKIREVPDGREPYRVAERFELYVDGMEIANGYHELCDAGEQRRRIEQNNQSRILDGNDRLPVESSLLNEMATKQLPGCCGVAAGIDRLLMVATASECLADVLTFDIKNA